MSLVLWCNLEEKLVCFHIVFVQNVFDSKICLSAPLKDFTSPRLHGKRKMISTNNILYTQTYQIIMDTFQKLKPSRNHLLGSLKFGQDILKSVSFLKIGLVEKILLNNKIFLFIFNLIYIFFIYMSLLSWSDFWMFMWNGYKNSVLPSQE